MGGGGGGAKGAAHGPWQVQQGGWFIHWFKNCFPQFNRKQKAMNGKQVPITCAGHDITSSRKPHYQRPRSWVLFCLWLLQYLRGRVKRSGTQLPKEKGKEPAAFKSKLPFWMFWYMERAVRRNASSTLSPVLADASM
jgi:hypothetical protein